MAAAAQLRRSTSPPRAGRSPSQRQIPSFCDKSLLAEVVVALAVDTLEPRLPVDSTCRGQLALGPQRHFSVPGDPGERDAFVDQASADAVSPRLRLDEQQAKFRDAVRL